MPDRAIPVAREGYRPLDGVARHVAFDRDVQGHTHKPVRIVQRALRDEVRPQRARRMPAPGENVRNVGGHASGERDPEGLDG